MRKKRSLGLALWLVFLLLVLAAGALLFFGGSAFHAERREALDPPRSARALMPTPAAMVWRAGGR